MALSIRGAKYPCLKEWYSRNQHCYKVFKEQKTWNDAEAFCHLASIHTTIQTADMADYVAENLKSGQSVWIGLHDPEQMPKVAVVPMIGSPGMAFVTSSMINSRLGMKQRNMSGNGQTEPTLTTYSENQESRTTSWKMSSPLSSGMTLIISSGTMRTAHPCVLLSASANTSANCSFACSRGSGAPGEAWRIKEALLHAEISALAPLRFMDAFCSLDLILLTLVDQKRALCCGFLQDLKGTFPISLFYVPRRFTFLSNRATNGSMFSVQFGTSQLLLFFLMEAQNKTQGTGFILLGSTVTHQGCCMAKDPETGSSWASPKLPTGRTSWSQVGCRVALPDDLPTHLTLPSPSPLFASLRREGRKTMGRFSFLILGLLVVVLSLSGAKGCCPHEWFSSGAFCYKVFEEAKTWEEAEKYCKKYQRGCHLASLDLKEESEDMAVHISQKFKVNIWIGLSRPSHKENWKWSDGSKVSYTSWKPGKPNNKQMNENCVELWAESSYKKWNNENLPLSPAPEGLKCLVKSGEVTKLSCLPKSLLCTPSFHGCFLSLGSDFAPPDMARRSNKFSNAWLASFILQSQETVEIQSSGPPNLLHDKTWH
ncbi:hypothetical protein L345_11405, partial [Ophiophagus hannah]